MSYWELGSIEGVSDYFKLDLSMSLLGSDKGSGGDAGSLSTASQVVSASVQAVSLNCTFQPERSFAPKPTECLSLHT